MEVYKREKAPKGIFRRITFEGQTEISRNGKCGERKLSGVPPMRILPVNIHIHIDI